MFTKLYNQTNQQRSQLSRIRASLPKAIHTIYGKSYPRFPCFMLPSVYDLTFSLRDALMSRQSFRHAMSKKIPDKKQLSSLLFYSAGIKSLPDKKIPFARRMYPSAGARYPLEIYLCLRIPINPLQSGIYHYNVQLHALEQLPIVMNDESIKKEILGDVNGYWLKDCWGIILISAVFQRTEIKYGRASFRYVFLEAGHMMQNLYLVSTALNLGCCSLGGFADKTANTFLHLDNKKEVVVYAANLVY